MADSATPVESERSGVWLPRLCVLLGLLGIASAAWYVNRRPVEKQTAPVVTASVRPPDTRIGGRVVLGSNSLFAGIPGGAKLSIQEIRDWLDDPKNHEPLDFELPLWLRGSRAELKIPANDPLTRAKIELGRQLFVESRFTDGGLDCVTCHAPTQHFTRATIFTEHKNAPTMLNRILSTHQFWDGRAVSLEHQVEFPIRHPQEMNTTPEDCEQRLSASEGYRMQFEAIYGEISYLNMTKAIAAFERALVTGPGAYDYHVVLQRFADRDSSTLTSEEQSQLDEAAAGSKQRPFSPAAERGKELFFSDRSGCFNCHSGPNFSDEQFHNLGIGAGYQYLHEFGGYHIPDDGRYRVTNDEADYAAFKTPTLRNVKGTASYMHDGSLGTLQEVVEFLVAGGRPNKNLSPLIHKLDLGPTEIQDLVAFLESLSGDVPVVALDHLPE
jgi:cytochrome c peroxidase